MQNLQNIRAAVWLAAIFMASLSAGAQSDLFERVRAGITGAAKGMDEVGRKANELIGSAVPVTLGESQQSPYTERRRFEERYPTGPAPVVSISNEFGEIRVETWNERVVQVSAEISAGAESTETAVQLAKAIEIKVSPAQDLFEIKTLFPETRSDMGRISLAVQYRIMIPRDASLVADNFFGDVVVRGVGGLVGLDVRYGAVDIAQCGGQVRVKSNGEFPVKANGLAQGGVFNLRGAHAEIQDAHGNLQVSNFGGLVKLATIGPELLADITVESGRAEIELDPAVNPDVTVTMVYGSLAGDLEMARSGQAERFVARHPVNDAKQRINLTASFSEVVVGGKNPGNTLVSGAKEGQVFNGTLEEKMTVTDPVTVIIEAAAPGAVRVEGIDENAVRVSATRVVWMPNATQAPQALEVLKMNVQKEPGKIAVNTVADGDMARFGCTSYKIELLVQVPRTAIVNISAADGLTSLSGLGGETTVTQTRGDVAAEHAKGMLKLSNQSGNVHVSDCAGPVDLSVRQGEIRAERVFGRVSAQNTAGRTIIESPGGEVTVRNTDGDARLLSLEPIRGNIDIRVEKGGLSALIAPESSAEITLRAGQGRVQSSIPLTGSIGGERQEFTGRLSDSQFKILLQADNGDIVLN